MNTVSGSSNVTQTVNVGDSKPGKLIAVVIPIVAAVIGAGTGAYLNHWLALTRAPERTASGAETLLGLARETIELARSTKAAPEVVQDLESLVSQAQAVQASARLLQEPKGVSLQADFWLPMNKGAQLGQRSSFGVNGAFGPGDIRVQLNDVAHRMQAGYRLPYKSNDGASCYVMYVGPSPDGKIHGFKTSCGG